MFIKLDQSIRDDNQSSSRRSVSSTNPFDEGREAEDRHRGDEEDLINEMVVEGQGTRRQLAG